MFKPLSLNRDLFGKFSRLQFSNDSEKNTDGFFKKILLGVMIYLQMKSDFSRSSHSLEGMDVGVGVDTLLF